MLLLPWNLFRLASLSLAVSEPKNMSELIDLALPNLLTASAPAGPDDMGDAAFLGFLSKSLSHDDDFEADFDTFSLRSCSNDDLLDLLDSEQMESILELELLPQPLSPFSFSTTSKSSKNLSLVLVWNCGFLELDGSSCFMIPISDIKL